MTYERKSLKSGFDICSGLAFLMKLDEMLSATEGDVARISEFVLTLVRLRNLSSLKTYTLSVH